MSILIIMLRARLRSMSKEDSNSKILISSIDFTKTLSRISSRFNKRAIIEKFSTIQELRYLNPKMPLLVVTNQLKEKSVLQLLKSLLHRTTKKL